MPHSEPELMRTDPFAAREQNPSQVHIYPQYSLQNPGESYVPAKNGGRKKMQPESNLVHRTGPILFLE